MKPSSDERRRIDQVAAVLASSYGMTVERLEPAARGWTGETFTVTVRGGERIFVKVYPKDRLPPTAAAALPVLAELHRIGLTWVTRPISTTSGALYERIDGDLVVVFAYLDAKQFPFTFGGERLGDMIAHVHQQTKQVTSPLAREAFTPTYGEKLWQVLDRGRQEPARDEPRQGLRQYLDEQGNAIANGWTAFGEIAQACRAARFDLVLTHGDWPFNLLRSADGTLYLIDWDELLLAPAERDTWFAGEDAAFWRGYRARRDRAADPLATAYYVHNRYFEEVLGFARVILDDGVLENRAWSLALLTGEWMAGLRERMRKTPH